MIKAVNSQLFRFGLVGGIAAATHFCLVILLVNKFNLLPLIANIFAFFIAFFVSLFGHQYWTFHTSNVTLSTSVWRFFTVAGLGLLFNECLFFLLLTVLHLYYPLALFIVLLIVPPVTFICSKYWVFCK